MDDQEFESVEKALRNGVAPESSPESSEPSEGIDAARLTPTEFAALERTLAGNATYRDRATMDAAKQRLAPR